MAALDLKAEIQFAEKVKKHIKGFEDVMDKGFLPASVSRSQSLSFERVETECPVCKTAGVRLAREHALCHFIGRCSKCKNILYMGLRDYEACSKAE